MIKIFSGTDLEKLEKEVNDFMEGRARKDCAVRTNTYGSIFVCTVFYSGVGG